MKKIAIFIFFIGTQGLLFSQSQYNDTIKSFEKHCYCTMNYAHPSTILKYGNNWELMFTFRHGKSLSELDKTEIVYTKKQIAVLHAANLIEFKDDKYYSLVSILTKNETTKLRLQSKEFANDIFKNIQDNYKQFQHTLSIQGLTKNTFTIFFSFVLDDLVWQKLEENKISKHRDLDTESPFWTGIYWLTNPKRDFSCGTNSISSLNYKFAVNWTDNEGVSFSNFEIIEDALKDLKDNGKITNTSIKNIFLLNGIVNEDGRFNIPIIKMNKTDEIFLLSDIIANKTAEYLLNNIDYTQIQKDYMIRKKEDAVVILYHEIMWDILDIMEEKGLINKPIAFSNPTQTKQTDLKDLTFIIEN